MTANSIDIKRLYAKGLEPDDFIKYTLPLHEDDVDDLIFLNIGAEKLTLPSNHTNIALTNEELKSICYQRVDDDNPSVLVTVDRLCRMLNVEPEHLPAGLVEAQMKLYEEYSYGSRSFKNFKRRLERKLQRKHNKIKEKPNKKSKGMLQVEHKDQTLYWD